MKLLVDEEDIDNVKEKIKDISKYYLPDDDYSIWSILDDEAEQGMANKIVYLITFSIVFFLGIIGVSNAYSSINNNLRNRRREFAILKYYFFIFKIMKLEENFAAKGVKFFILLYWPILLHIHQ